MAKKDKKDRKDKKHAKNPVLSEETIPTAPVAAPAETAVDDSQAAPTAAGNTDPHEDGFPDTSANGSAGPVSEIAAGPADGVHLTDGTGVADVTGDEGKTDGGGKKRKSSKSSKSSRSSKSSGESRDRESGKKASKARESKADKKTGDARDSREPGKRKASAESKKSGAPGRKKAARSTGSGGGVYRSAFREPAAQIRKGLLRQLFSGAYMLRWNDKLRPCPLAEMDKQAHKMIVALILWCRACDELPEDMHYVLGREIIEGALFDYCFRLVVTDIKPPIFYRILADERQYDKLSHYVFSQLEPVLSPLGDFWDRFRIWHERGASFPEARRILSASHLFASHWEFRLIEPLNTFDREMPAIAENFVTRLDAFRGDVPGMADILDPGGALADFASFSGQLRFQVRWTQIPRIPQTDVLGHMFFVAALSYLYSLTLGTCRARAVNNFFCGLLHDLPELLTRDIITPVKRSSSEMTQLVRECEDRELHARILDPLEKAGEKTLVRRLRYYLGLDMGSGSEFSQRIVRKGEPVELADFEELHRRHDRDEEHPLDGRLVKACDHLSAFMEADESIRNGVSSNYLVNARMRLAQTLRDRTFIPARMHMDSLLADFD